MRAGGQTLWIEVPNGFARNPEAQKYSIRIATCQAFRDRAAAGAGDISRPVARS
jgi:hypothetical protein